MKKALATLAFLATAGTTVAQTSCPPPVVKVLRNNQEVPATGAALAPSVTLVVSSSPACPSQASYRFREADVTLMRGRRPLLPPRRMQGPEIDLRGLTSIAQPGDRIHIFVAYKDLRIVAADGKLLPYTPPVLSPDQQKGIGAALAPEEATGISFNWVLQK